MDTARTLTFSIKSNSGSQCFIILPTLLLILKHISCCFRLKVHLSILLEFGFYSPVFDRKVGLLAHPLDHGTVRSKGGTGPRWLRSVRHSPEPAYASGGQQLTETEADREVKEGGEPGRKSKPKEPNLCNTIPNLYYGQQLELKAF